MLLETGGSSRINLGYIEMSHLGLGRGGAPTNVAKWEFIRLFRVRGIFRGRYDSGGSHRCGDGRKGVVKAEARLRMLKAAGICRPKLGSARLRLIYGALINPVWSYAFHVTPLTETLEEKAGKLIDAATRWMFPNLRKHSRKRMRRLLALKDVDI